MEVKRKKQLKISLAVLLGLGICMRVTDSSFAQVSFPLTYDSVQTAVAVDEPVFCALEESSSTKSFNSISPLTAPTQIIKDGMICDKTGCHPYTGPRPPFNCQGSWDHGIYPIIIPTGGNCSSYHPRDGFSCQRCAPGDLNCEKRVHIEAGLSGERCPAEREGAGSRCTDTGLGASGCFFSSANPKIYEYRTPSGNYCVDITNRCDYSCSIDPLKFELPQIVSLPF